MREWGDNECGGRIVERATDVRHVIRSDGTMPVHWLMENIVHRRHSQLQERPYVRRIPYY